MSAVQIVETGNALFPYNVVSPCMSIAEAQAKAARVADVAHAGFLPTPTPEQQRVLTAWELEHADGAFVGSGSSQILIVPRETPELTPEQAALQERAEADEPSLGLNVETVGRDGEE